MTAPALRDDAVGDTGWGAWHPNTVRHRLARLESVTGRSLRDFETPAELWWALQAARLRDG